MNRALTTRVSDVAIVEERLVMHGDRRNTKPNDSANKTRVTANSLNRSTVLRGLVRYDSPRQRRAEAG